MQITMYFWNGMKEIAKEWHWIDDPKGSETWYFIKNKNQDKTKKTAIKIWYVYVACLQLTCHSTFILFAKHSFWFMFNKFLSLDIQLNSWTTHAFAKGLIKNILFH